jgi:ABC-2 type transport system ATP-binding protein
MQLLMGFMHPTSGSVEVLGQNPAKTPRTLKQYVSYVPEQVQIYEWMRVEEVFHFGQWVHPRWDQSYALHLAQRLDLPLRRKLGQLSRGMQGKVALTVALASHPRLLLLDDPPTGLDALVRREVMESLIGALQEAETTVFLSSHLIQDVERVVDWVGVLHEAKLLCQMPLEELKREIKRVMLVGEGGAERLDHPGVLEHTVLGRQHTVIWKDFGPAEVQWLLAGGWSAPEVQDCSLEDIFVALIRHAGHGRQPGGEAHASA